MVDRVGNIESEKARGELNRLTIAGASVLPRAIGDSVTYNKVEYPLNNTQKSKFKKIYNIANKGVDELVSLSQYEKATDDVKAKAVKFIYDVYYELAVCDTLGVDTGDKNVLFAEAINIEKLAIIIATARSIGADTDRNGNSISGSKKKKIEAYIQSLRLSAAQKYMIMGYLGYSNARGRAQVETYIRKLNLSKAEKEALLEYSGYKSK